MSLSDTNFMERAFTLACAYDGLTGSNPSVGAVIVKNNKIIAEGVHKGVGRDHAEPVAIKKAISRYGKEALKGAKIYVTLEPCSSWGKTPPCTKLLEKAEIGEIVIGAWDPNPVNYKKSLSLRSSGIKIRKLRGKLAEKIKKFYRPFEVFIKERRPYLITKLAQTLDGYVIDRAGNSKWITSMKMRQLVHIRLRYRVDAIITGINTVLKDNPQLTIRVGQKKLPKRLTALYRVVLDSNLDLPASSRLIETVSSKFPLLLCISNSVSEKKKEDFLSAIEGKKNFVQIITMPAEDGRFNLNHLLLKLADRGISRALLEAGPTLVGAFLKLGKVDRIVVCQSLSFLGDGKKGVEIPGLSVDKRLWLKDPYVEQVGLEVWVEGDVYWDNQTYS